jgi:hypothetical protein
MKQGIFPCLPICKGRFEGLRQNREETTDVSTPLFFALYQGMTSVVPPPAE